MEHWIKAAAIAAGVMLAGNAGAAEWIEHEGVRVYANYSGAPVMHWHDFMDTDPKGRYHIPRQIHPQRGYRTSNRYYYVTEITTKVDEWGVWEKTGTPLGEFIRPHYDPARGRSENAYQGGVIDGGAGDDHLSGSSRGDDTMYGGDGNDIMFGDQISHNGYRYVNPGCCYRWGGDDTMYGGRGDDWMHGKGGNDFMDGQDGTDWMFGGFGNDTMHGGDGHDLMLGGNGYDEMHGGKGRDYLEGGFAADTLNGGKGRDILYGNPQNDKYRNSRPGPYHADRFVFEGRSGRDKIMDFSREDGDKIVMRGRTFADLKIRAKRNSSVIRFGKNRIKVKGVTNLRESDFEFIP